jgi:hypothetical protein
MGTVFVSNESGSASHKSKEGVKWHKKGNMDLLIHAYINCKKREGPYTTLMKLLQYLNENFIIIIIIGKETKIKDKFKSMSSENNVLFCVVKCPFSV